MTELLTDIEPFLTAVTVWVQSGRSPESSQLFRQRLEELRRVLTNRATDFDTTVRRPCGLFRNVPEHLTADDSRVDDVFNNIAIIRHAWESWFNGFRRFAQNASFAALSHLEEALNTHEHEDLIHERDLVEREGLEFMNRTIQEIREIHKKIELIRLDADSIRDADEQIESFERRQEVLKHDLDEHDPAKGVKQRIVEYFERLPSQMHRLESAANDIHREFEHAFAAIDLILANLETQDQETLVRVGDSLTILARLLTGRPSF